MLLFDYVAINDSSGDHCINRKGWCSLQVAPESLGVGLASDPFIFSLYLIMNTAAVSNYTWEITGINTEVSLIDT